MTYREDGREDRSILVTAFNGTLFGLDPTTGAVRWRHALGHGGTVELQLHAGRVFASTSQALFCFEYPSGVLLGQVRIPTKYWGRPTMLIEGDRVFLGTSGELSCFDLSGNVLWTQPFQGDGLGAMALAFPGNVRQADDLGSR